MEYDYSSHAKYFFLAQILFAIKYRKRLFIQLEDEIKGIICGNIPRRKNSNDGN